MRELCLYKNEIICIELCCVRIDGTIKIFENQIGESQNKNLQSKISSESGQNESFLRSFF